jgi:hypothetical protein
MAQTFEEDKKVLDQVLEDWKNDSILSKTDPSQSLIDNMAFHAKYLKILSVNALNVKKADDEYRVMRRLRASYYDGSLEQSLLKKYNWEPYLGAKPKISSQKEELLSADEFLIDIEKRRKVYEIIVDNCEKIIKEINSRHYSIKAYMDWERTIRQA